MKDCTATRGVIMSKPQHGAGQEAPMEQEREPRTPSEDDELVDAQSDQSFPASDPPSWTLGPD